MRIVVLRTFGSNCAPIYKPLVTLGHEVHAITYDQMIQTDHQALPAVIGGLNPDWVLMFGTCISEGSPAIPTVHTLDEIGKKYPFVHLCCDGAEPVWWPQLQNYYDHNTFALHINLDGVKAGPIAERGMVELTPTDPSEYPDPPVVWEDRNILLGFCGGYGGPQPRTWAIKELVDAGLLIIRERDFPDNDSFDGYIKFMTSCKCVWNHAFTGTGDRMHVKGRVIEAALAGAVLFETSGSPTSDWFIPGIDYVACSGATETRKYLNWVLESPMEARNMAASLRRKVVKQHAALPFWNKVLIRLGFGNA